MKIKSTLILLAMMLNSGCMLPFLLLEEASRDRKTYDNSQWEKLLNRKSTVVLAKAVNKNGYMKHEFVAFVKNENNRSKTSVNLAFTNYSGGKDEKDHYTIIIPNRESYFLTYGHTVMGGHKVRIKHILDDLKEKKIITSGSNE